MNEKFIDLVVDDYIYVVDFPTVERYLLTEYINKDKIELPYDVPVGRFKFNNGITDIIVKCSLRKLNTDRIELDNLVLYSNKFAMCMDVERLKKNIRRVCSAKR